MGGRLIRVSGTIATAITFAAFFTLIAACDSGSETIDLAAPELSGPIDLSTFQARSFVEFSWSPVEGATSYEISFEYEDFPEEDIIVSTQVPLTVQELVEIGTIRWRVRAVSEGNAGPWSATQTVFSRPTELAGILEAVLTFSTSGLEVGETIALRSETSLFEAVLAPVVNFNASQRDIRDVVITDFHIEITEPAGTVMDQFSSWQVTARDATGEVTLLALSEPAPAEPSITTQDFQRPADWLSIALDAVTDVEMRATMNPRSPRETTVGWSLTIDFTVFVNR